MKEDPSNALRNYSEKSTGIMEYIKNQLKTFSSWVNIPGGVRKISASSSGNLWTIGQWDNDKWGIYACKEPCTEGNWTYPINSNLNKSWDPDSKLYPLDIATDDTYAYMLWIDRTGNGREVWKAPANDISSRPISWDKMPVPDALKDANKIAVTNGTIWVSDGTKKAAYCSKPCATPNWVVKDSSYKIQGGGGNTLYATAPGSLGLMQTDEIMQSGWKPVKGLDGISISAVAPEANSAVLYAADSSKIYRCTDSCDAKEDLRIVNSEGRVPTQDKGGLSVNPANRNVWMASTTGGAGGNIFYRLDSPDIGSVVIDHVDQVENERDRIFNSLGGDVRVQTAEVSASMAKADAVGALKQALELSGDKDKADKEIQLLQRKIETANSQLTGIEEKRKPLIVLLISLAVVAVMYITVGWFMPYWLSMSIAVLVLGTGLGLSIYFSTNK